MNALQLWPMRGGIKLPANKNQSNVAPIRHAGIPTQLIFPLTQRELDAIPVVTIGQLVCKGELIARAGDEFGAPLHASTSGIIVAIEMRAVAEAHRQNALCIVLQSDGNDSWCVREPIVDFTTLRLPALIAKIRDAGVVGAGGAGFPAARKLLDAAGHVVPIDTLIINGAECEPYITADDRLMRERAVEIVNGIRILQHILQPQKILIGIEDENLEALKAMRAATTDTSLDIAAVPSIYPIGSEGQLVRVLTGKEIPSDGQHRDSRPSEMGVLCFNVGTAAAIYRAVTHNEPMLSRIVTITGAACTDPGNFDVLVGTPLDFLLEQAGYDAASSSTLIAGGAMMGSSLANTAVPITKTSHCFIAGIAREFPAQPAQSCIRCGYCAEVCPAALLPQQLLAYARADNIEQLQRHHLFDCIECGACDYICPSHIPLTQSFRTAKRDLQIVAYEQQQAVVAKQRFVAHQTRIARELEERTQQRQRRLQNNAATTTDATTEAPVADSKKAAIQAAISRAKAKKGGAQQPAVMTALTSNELPTDRLRRRVEELNALIDYADGGQRERLQRARDDLYGHLAAAEANPTAEPTRDIVERALAAARATENPE